MFRTHFAACLLCFGMAIPLVAQESADALAARIQARYTTVRDFEAAFEQTYVGGTLRRRTTERGTMSVKKPGRMRWEYTDPERKLFVSDGRRMYAYVPADKQVTIVDVPPDSVASTPVMFLAGRGDLTRDFTVAHAVVDDAPPDTLVLTLTPRVPQAEYTTLILAVDRTTLTPRMLRATDAQGGTSTFTFSRLRENMSPPDKAFTFVVPKGVDVVTQNN